LSKSTVIGGNTHKENISRKLLHYMTTPKAKYGHEKEWKGVLFSQQED